MENIERKLKIDERIFKCREKFEVLLKGAKEESGSNPLDVTEAKTFADVLELGKELLEVKVMVEAAKDEARHMKSPAGDQLPYHSDKVVKYRSVFGIMQIKRSYYWEEGKEGFCPLDARINLPQTKDSYLLQKWALRMDACESYDESRGGLKELLNLDVPKRQLENQVGNVGTQVEEFYANKPTATSKDEGSILVVAADGKGVAMRKAADKDMPKRLSKGQKRQKKRMAKVGAIYTADPRFRTDKQERAAIYNKEVLAQLKNREGFAQQLFERAKQRETGIRKKVFLSDGEKALWEMKEKYFADYEGILDWMHAAEYLWRAAYLFLPESSQEAKEWVHRQEGRFIKGEVKEVIRTLKKLVQDGTIQGKEKCKKAQNIINYYERNCERMRYGRYIRRGLPIGSGAVEGTCKYLVKQRMEGSGMSWTIGGAQAILNLRAVYLSKHWDSFWQWFQAKEAERLYGNAASIKLPVQKKRKVA